MSRLQLPHAALLACAWLILSPVSQAAEEKHVAQTAPPNRATPFDQYRNFHDVAVQDWKKSNERVNEVGGWRTYLRESYQDDGNAGQDRHQH